MIKFLPEIYPGEAIYSYLSRLFSRSGYIWNSGFTREVFGKALPNIDYTFPRTFGSEFKKLIDEQIGVKELILDHTVFKYYARFLPVDKRKLALEQAMDNQQFLAKYLPVPQRTNESKLRYCPVCVEEDRMKYGEAYIHVEHTIPDIDICSKHCCGLLDIAFINSKHNNTNFMPLEHVIDEMSRTIYDEEDIDVKVTKYITEVFRQPLELEKEVVIGNFLSNKLEDKYISSRGEQRYLEELLVDLKEFYWGLNNFDITKNKLAYIFRNMSCNPYEILLLSMFQRIMPKELTSYEGEIIPKHILVDQKVRELHQSGWTMHKISQELKMDHEVVRQILLGTYDKPKKDCSPYKCQRWDWESIDAKCCDEFDCKVVDLTKKDISKSVVADMFHLKDKTLRNLPQLASLIRKYKSSI